VPRRDKPRPRGSVRHCQNPHDARGTGWPRSPAAVLSLLRVASGARQVGAASSPRAISAAAWRPRRSGRPCLGAGPSPSRLGRVVGRPSGFSPLAGRPGAFSYRGILESLRAPSRLPAGCFEHLGRIAVTEAGADARKKIVRNLFARAWPRPAGPPLGPG